MPTTKTFKTSLLILCLGVIFHCKSDKLVVCNSCTYSDLANAVKIANPFDTILVKPGTYDAVDIRILKPLTLIGENGAILDGKTQTYIIAIGSDSVTVSGFEFINSGRSYTKDYAAIYISRSRNFLIENNTVVNPFFGILTEKSHDGIIRNNHLYGITVREDQSGNGIHAWHCSNLTIEGNEIHGLRDGIYLEFVDDSFVNNNNSHNNIRYGLHYMFSNRDEYIGNTFSQNGAGVAVMFSKFIVMKDNTFINNWGTASYGLLLKEINDAEVTDNHFTSNTIGIFLEGTTRINYINNTFTSNGWAIKVSGGCYTNSFLRNNFISNSFDVAYNSKMNDNVFASNYWSEYSGYDLDKDGLGDIPYRPVKLFSYVVTQTPESIVLLRSLFIDLLNFSERVSPVFTPDDLVDNSPSMRLLP